QIFCLNSLLLRSRLRERQFFLPACKSGRSLELPDAGSGCCICLGQIQTKNENGGRPMTSNVSRRSLLALGAGLGVSTMVGETALAKAPKQGTQPAYFYRFGLGDAEVTVVSDGPLPLGPPKGTFVGVPDDDVKKMLSDNFLSPDNVVLEQNSPIVNTGDK